MRFLFLIHGDAEAEAALTPTNDARSSASTWPARRCSASGYVLGEVLEGSESAALVRPGTSRSSPTSRSQTKEAVGGFYLIDCASRDEAIDLAGHAPASPGAAVEIPTIAGGV
ncbi:MAG: hypothetical protein H0U08_00840 [Actinobacteria bacterium]|nr:hypothetical protein [Actinomycetota bacterium]